MFFFRVVRRVNFPVDEEDHDDDDDGSSQPTTTRQAKFKALEAISISHQKRRSEPEFDSTPVVEGDEEDNSNNNEPTNSKHRKRTHSKQTSSSSSSSQHSTRHVSNTVRRRKRSEKSSPKTFKRQRQSSSDDDDERRFTQHSKAKRNSAPIFNHRTRSKSNRRQRTDSHSEPEQQTEGADTGNLCVRRGAGQYSELHQLWKV